MPGACASTSQTVGPFFHLGLTAVDLSNLAGPNVKGEHITLEGHVLDGDRVPVPDALIEVWQANSHGKYAHEADCQRKPLDAHFRGYGRTATLADGSFRFRTIRPGQVPGTNGALQAPHIEVCVFMRGLLKQLVTRVYFENDPANANDYVLRLIEPARRNTLVARAEGENVYRWNILLQGEDETVFFDV